MVNPHDSSTPPSSISPASKIVLYSNWQSSCSWRVRFALNLKGLPYEYKAVDLAKGEHLTPEFEKLNPLHLVPVLVDGDFVVSDSYAILMYLEEKYPENALLPVDLRLRALNLQAANIISSSVQPLVMLGVLKLIEEKVGPEERLSWAQYNIDKGFIALEKLLKNSSGKYATGDKIFMEEERKRRNDYILTTEDLRTQTNRRCHLQADVFLAPQIAIAARRFNMDMSKYPTLSMIFESCKALSEFKASLPERQPDAIQ
ncbi:hypothetical protein RHGRI_019215 [Rhododendron griersonianum]|uniref:glutathione transferase n=1 Tax=Rhododendron griersonianum TaxID=479676 RepID=A0AAV6JBL8_9ERIC|nr:hypothetical protein RHGRI_019215 [Rhododendron griersonianum]